MCRGLLPTIRRLRLGRKAASAVAVLELKRRLARGGKKNTHRFWFPLLTQCTLFACSLQLNSGQSSVALRNDQISPPSHTPLPPIQEWLSFCGCLSQRKPPTPKGKKKALRKGGPRFVKSQFFRLMLELPVLAHLVLFWFKKSALWGCNPESGTERHASDTLYKKSSMLALQRGRATQKQPRISLGKGRGHREGRRREF